MHNLASFLHQWRQSMAAAPHLTPETLDELESHLRERIEQLIHSGVPETEACQRAAAELGSPQTVAAEFRKLAPTGWLPVKIATGFALVGALALACLLIFRPFTHPSNNVLLAVHVFTVTLGYGAGLLLGALGTCFILQRAWSDFSPRRAAPLSRATLAFATAATVFTAIGIVLGMVWSKREWGRYWGWDAKEIGALCIIVWMTGFLAAHYFRWVTTRGLFVASVLGSNVVFLGWFGAHLPRALHNYGWGGPAGILLFGAVAANVLIAALGLAPAGWLRWRKA